MLTPREKSPLPKMSPEEDRTRDAVDSEPKHYQLSYSGARRREFLKKCFSGPTTGNVGKSSRSSYGHFEQCPR